MAEILEEGTTPRPAQIKKLKATAGGGVVPQKKKAPKWLTWWKEGVEGLGTPSSLGGNAPIPVPPSVTQYNQPASYLPESPTPFNNPHQYRRPPKWWQSIAQKFKEGVKGLGTPYGLGGSTSLMPMPPSLTQYNQPAQYGAPAVTIPVSGTGDFDEIPSFNPEPSFNNPHPYRLPNPQLLQPPEDTGWGFGTQYDWYPKHSRGGGGGGGFINYDTLPDWAKYMNLFSWNYRG